MTRKTTATPAPGKAAPSPKASGSGGAKAKAAASLVNDLQKKLDERLRQRREVKRMKK